MQAHEFAELATLVATHGPSLVRLPGEIPRDGLEDYWIASKSRLDAWASFLKRAGDDGYKKLRNHLAGTVEEIVVSEMLTRVWGAVLTAHDELREDALAGPIGKTILLGHIEIRNRALRHLVDGKVPLYDAVRLNRLVEKTERWTDLLVGRLMDLADVSVFAFDAGRARDFCDDLTRRKEEPGSRLIWPLLLSSLRAGYRRSLCPLQPHTELNERVAAAVVSCFKAEVFDESGVPRPYWLARLLTLTHDAEMILDEAMTSFLRDEGTLEENRRWKRLRRFGL